MSNYISFCMDDHLGCQYIQDLFCKFKHSVETVLMLCNSQQNNVTCARLEFDTVLFFSNFRTSLDCLSLKMKVVRSFEMSGTMYPTTQRNVPKVLS